MIVAMFVAVALIGYLLGSIPFGLLIGRRSTGADVRRFGSGRTGATNVLRTAGKKAAVLVLVLDLLKGALAVIFARLMFGGDYAAGSPGLWGMATSAYSLAALAAVLGHAWPVFVKFKGGRGVAPFLGGLLVLSWPAALLGAAVLILVTYLTRYVSLGSVTGVVATCAVLVPFTIIKGSPIEYLAYAGVCAIFIIIMHRDNIGRLISGTERKFGEKV